MEHKSSENRPALVSDDGSFRDINIAFYNIPLLKRLPLKSCDFFSFLVCLFVPYNLL